MPHKFKQLHQLNVLVKFMRVVLLGQLKWTFLKEMIGQCSELDGWSVFHMALCVACFVVLSVKRL
jgi:hypothetical protein